MRFKDKVAIITGAASGMGLLSAQCLIAEGAKVVLVDVNAEAVEAAAEELRKDGGEAIGIQVDVRNYDQVEKAAATALEKFGSIDIMMNYAGGAETRVLNCNKPFYEQPIEVIDWGIDVNLKGPVYFCRAVLGTMIKQKSGVIINLGSVTGIEGAEGATCYSTSKSGIIGLTKSLALSGAPHNVRACCVSPRTRADSSWYGKYENPSWPCCRAAGGGGSDSLPLL